MSTSEIAHRVRERIRRMADHSRFLAGLESEDDPELDDLIQREGGSLKDYFMCGPASRFYASTQEREAIRNICSRRFPEWLDSSIREATAFCGHRVNLLAYSDVQLGRRIDWHRDPISGFQWPRRFWASYDLVRRPPADVKIIHELNRHKHLPRLAKTFFLTGEELYAQEAIAQIESWIAQNPKWYGVNWHSSLEMSLRSVSWLWTIFLLLSSASLDEEKLRRICRSLFAQLDHVYRYPSSYTSPNTHLIGEATALFIAGVLFPELPRAANWREFGVNTLIDEIRRQVLDDGVYGELSSYYHCYATDFLLQVLALARRNQIRFPECVWDRLSRMIEFVMHITRSDGTIPLLGDDDGGRALAIASDNYASYSDGLCSGSVLFGRPDFKYQAGEFCEDSLWLLGEAAWPVFRSLVARQPEALHRVFEDGGYITQRSGWGNVDTLVTFDCGGLGLGSGGHAHADALSLTLFSNGHEFLIDPGTAAYNCAPDWRRFFRSTMAHNTVVVDDAGQAEPGSTFRWARKATARLQKEISLAETHYADASVEFARFSNPVTHRRRVIHVRPNYWIVLDELRGQGAHNYDFLYHFAPDTQLTVLSDDRQGEIDCRASNGEAGLQLSLYASEAIRAEAVCGQRDPIQGWSSQVYGMRRASTVLKASVSGTAPVAMLSFLAPGQQPVHSHRLKSNNKHAIAAVIRDGWYDDIAVMVIEDGDVRFLDYVMSGEFFVLRLENGVLRRLLAVNARSFSHSGDTVFSSPDPVPFVQAHFWENGILIEREESLSLREKVTRNAG